MNNLVIHIGPPKTATTSLQFFLQQIKMKNFVYGGKLDNSKRLSSYFDIVSGENKREVKGNVEKILQQNKTLFLSEESFLIEEERKSWRDKIKKLHEYFYDYNPVLLLTIREPKKAVISFYIEMYHALPSCYRKDFGLFLKSDYCSIYKYQTLVAYLDMWKFNINIIDYEKMICGEYWLSDFLMNNLTEDYRIILQKRYVTLNDKNCSYYVKPQTVRGMVSLRIVSKIANMRLANVIRKDNKYKCIARKILDKTLSIIPKIELPAKEINLDFDSYDYVDFINEYNIVKDNLLR